MGMRRYLAACAIAAFGLSILFVGLQVISSATSPPRPTVSATASLKSTSAEGSSGGKGRVDAATRAARRARRAEALFLSKSRGKEESQAARRRAAEVNSFRHSNNGTMVTQQQQQHDGASHGTKDDGDGSDVDGRRKRQLLLPPVCTAGDDRVKWLNDPILHSRVHDGLEITSKLRIVFAGLVHRKAPGRFRSLDLEVDSFHNLGSTHFLDYHIVLYESNSHADTLKQMGRLCSHPKMSCVGEGQVVSKKASNGDISMERLTGMAAMRNIYLDFILNNNQDSASSSGSSDREGGGGGRGSLSSSIVSSSPLNFFSLLFQSTAPSPIKVQAAASASTSPKLSSFDVMAVADLDLHSVTEHFLPFRMEGGETNHTYHEHSLADGWSPSSVLAAFGWKKKKENENENENGVKEVGRDHDKSDGGEDKIDRRSKSKNASSQDQSSPLPSSSSPSPISLPWSVACGNGVVEKSGRLYDSFALEPKDLGHQRGWVFSERDPIEVDSCFGGLAFYDLQRLRKSGCRYAAADMLCEHTGLHRCLLEKKNAGEEDGGSSSGGGVGGNGGLYLFPLLVNQMDRELPRKCVPLK